MNKYITSSSLTCKKTGANNHTIDIKTRYKNRNVRIDVTDKGNTLWSYDNKVRQDISDADVIKIVRMITEDTDTARRIINSLNLA